MAEFVENIVHSYKSDKTRLMDILIKIQTEKGYISDENVSKIALLLNISKVDVEQTISFYHFFSQSPTGKFAIYLNNSVVSNIMGRMQVASAFEKEADCKFGSVTKDGLIGLFNTSCIGMNDQEPAAIINNIVFTRLTPFRAREIVRDIKSGKSLQELIVESYGDGMNNDELVKAMVSNNIRKKGPILEQDFKPGDAIQKAINMEPSQVIEEIKKSHIRGRGGAGFPTGMKWEITRSVKSENKYIFCNADEGEPGTFKDRVILTEYPNLLIDGMTIAAYAVGAKEGILYVRYEYRYLEKYLENILKEARTENLLGKNVKGKEGFDFDIRIQFGAGAYVCGEESALIESAEGKRGEPRDRPPFPVSKGYLNCPTAVNNVETFCSAAKILIHGGEWYKKFGTSESSGTKLLSISGDCIHPGVYEVEWGFSVNDILDMVGGHDVQAVQVGGPSGSIIAPNEFSRILGYEDLSTGGSLIIFGKHRDLLQEVVLNFTNFFIEESCGSCVPCRTVTTFMKQKLEKILDGHGVKNDIDDLLNWEKVMKSNRCGLGQTAANPIVTSIKNFRHIYESRIQHWVDFDSSFDMEKAVKESLKATGR